MKKTNRKILKVCPKCGGTNITPYTKLGLTRGEHLTDYCKDCYYGYPSEGFFPEVNIKDVQKFKNKIRKSKW